MSTLTEITEMAEAVDLCVSLGLRVATSQGLVHAIYWTFADLANYEPPSFVVPKRICRSKAEQRAHSFYRDAERMTWLAEDLLSRLVFYRQDEPEQRFLAKLITDYQGDAVAALSQTAYWLRRAGWKLADVRDQLRYMIREEEPS
jgi:hypothetical protein